MTREIQGEAHAPPCRRIDALGLKCPLPALKVRRALSAMAPGEILEIIADDAMSAIDIPFMASRNGGDVLSCIDNAGALTIHVRKLGDARGLP